jgi:recombination protein RecA
MAMRARTLTRSAPKIEEGAAPAIIKPKPRPLFSLKGTELEETISQIHGRFGKEVAEIQSNLKIYYDRIRSGIFTLDIALAGGFLTSRGSMVYGERSAGKTTTVMMTAVNAQRLYQDQVVAYIDVEGSFDIDWFIRLGGDPSRLLLCEPESGEHAVDIADALSRTKEVCMVVTDSIAMLIPMKEIEESAETSLVGNHARLIGNYLRKLNNAMLMERHRQHRLLVLHINQFRMKIGMSFGDPRTLPGGKALEFCTSQQVEMRNKEIISEDGDIKWNEHNFKITKDKTGGHIREGKFKLCRDPVHNNGLPEGTIDQIKSMHELGSRVGLAEGRMDFKKYGKWNSAPEAQAAMLLDPEKYAKLQIDIIMAHRLKWGLSVPSEYDLD